MRLPLEDNIGDIVGKACRGLKLTDAEIALRAGVSVRELAGLLAGQFQETVVRKVAPVLGLGVEALLASGRQTWYPRDPRTVTGLVWFSTPFGDMMVNSYVVYDPETKVAAAFDTGADCTDMLKLPVRIQQVFITHVHGDHVLELDRLVEKTGARAFVSDREPMGGAESFPDGRTFAISRLQVEPRRTSGHAQGGVTYVVTGLARQLAIVGDAMFAGSMGGGVVSYEEALRTNRESILTLPDDTIICPGHGPLTTVGEEKVHNPFFA